jgi:hypothetical protein
MMSGVSKSYSELYSLVCNDAPKFHYVVTIRSKSWRGSKLAKDASKKLFLLTELKKHVKRWNRCVEVEGDYVESNIGLVSVYLQ